MSKSRNITFDTILATAAVLSQEDRARLMNFLKNLAEKQHVDVRASLTPTVRKRKRANVSKELKMEHDVLLAKFNEESAALEAKIHEERAALDAKLLTLYQALYAKRSEIVNDEDADEDADDDADDDEDAEDDEDVDDDDEDADEEVDDDVEEDNIKVGKSKKERVRDDEDNPL